MPAETKRHSQTRHFLDVVDHRQHINALVIPAGPCTNHLDIFQDRKILDDTAGDTGSGQAVGDEIVIVGSKRLQAAVAAQHKGTVFRLVPVELAAGNAQHNIEHLRLCLGNQYFIELSFYRSINAYGIGDTAGFIAGTEQDLVSFIDTIVCDDLADPTFDLFQSHDLDTGDECHAQLQCLAVKAQCGFQRVGVSVRGTPACGNHFFGHVRTKLSCFVTADHFHFQPQLGALGGVVFQHLDVLVRQTQTQVAALMIFYINAQFLAQLRPDVLYRVHCQRQFFRITCRLADTAGVSAGTAIADLFLFQYQNIDTPLCQPAGCCTAHDAAANDDHICFSFFQHGLVLLYICHVFAERPNLYGTNRCSALNHAQLGRPHFQFRSDNALHQPLAGLPLTQPHAGTQIPLHFIGGTHTVRHCPTNLALGDLLTPADDHVIVFPFYKGFRIGNPNHFTHYPAPSFRQTSAR